MSEHRSKLELTAIKNEVMQLINMVDYIQDEYNVYLKPQASGWYQTNCLMPNHRDSNPSFGVNPEKGRFRCLSCGASGDLIALVQAIEGMSFVETIKHLAVYAGVSLDASVDASLGRMVRQMVRDVESYLNQSEHTPYPAQMNEPTFMMAIADRLKKYEADTLDNEWVEEKYLELDDYIEAADYNGCEKLWNTLASQMKNRKQTLAQAT